jgi:hypothetical protein
VIEDADGALPVTAVGVAIDLARTTDEDLVMTSRRLYDTLLSDMARDRPDASLHLLAAMRARGDQTPAALYVGRVDPARAGARLHPGHHDRPDELLHLVCDALERRRLS